MLANFFRMILILSNREDTSSDLVEERFLKNRKQYYRIDAEDIIENNFLIDFDGNKIQTNKFLINIDDVNVIWLRKFGFLKKFDFYKENEKKYKPFIINQLIDEHYEIMATIISLFINKRWITHPHTLTLSKFTILLEARKSGLVIPNSYITGNKKHVVDLLNHHGQLISKSIFEALFFNKGDYSYSMFTKQITKEDISELPHNFFPSLVQNRIKKKYEIRSFLLDNKLYSMAIFSQNDNLTDEDFRTLNTDKPIRFIPYQLPKKIESKILSLCEKLNLNCCSVDIIKSIKNEYVFLEVNPVGEFGMVSFPCNYNLHFEIYKTLLKYDEN